METKNEFKVYTTYYGHSNDKYCHWAEGLTMYIYKDNVKIKLNSEEIKQLVKSLPQTIGGQY